MTDGVPSGPRGYCGSLRFRRAARRRRSSSLEWNMSQNRNPSQRRNECERGKFHCHFDVLFRRQARANHCQRSL